MKKFIATLALMLLTSVSHAQAFVCTGYLDGSTAGDPITVNASKVSVAETKAYARMKKAGVKLDYVRCK